MFDSLSTADLNLVMQDITNLVPKAIPATIAFVAFRKGWQFFKSVLFSA